MRLRWRLTLLERAPGSLVRALLRWPRCAVCLRAPLPLPRAVAGTTRCAAWVAQGVHMVGHACVRGCGLRVWVGGGAAATIHAHDLPTCVISRLHVRLASLRVHRVLASTLPTDTPVPPSMCAASDVGWPAGTRRLSRLVREPDRVAQVQAGKRGLQREHLQHAAPVDAIKVRRTAGGGVQRRWGGFVLRALALVVNCACRDCPSVSSPAAVLCRRRS